MGPESDAPLDYNFEWDKRKNRQNLRKHGFDFADAEEMFRGILLVNPDTREDYGENRWVGIGMISGRTVHVAFAELNSKTIRIISLRKATRRETEQYQKAIQDKLEAD
ncbi:MAG TPA: BrnT family toxin [Candidatus Sulfotelmatobacter sp.]